MSFFLFPFNLSFVCAITLKMKLFNVKLDTVGNVIINKCISNYSVWWGGTFECSKAMKQEVMCIIL